MAWIVVVRLMAMMCPHRESEEHEQHWFWIGLNRRNPMDNGSWKWSDGLAVSHDNKQPTCRVMKNTSNAICLILVSQLTYQNFGRYYYNIRQCAAADLGSMTWLAMHCDSELDWICKIPRGKTAVDFKHKSCVGSTYCQNIYLLVVTTFVLYF